VSVESSRPKHQQLTLARSERIHVMVERSQEVQQVVPFLDLLIDGVSLRTMVQKAGCGDDFATMLCPRWVPSSVDSTVQTLLRGNSATGEPVDMLVCPVCADRDCGAVLADVTVTEQEVAWSNWRWTNYEPASGESLDLPTMRFERGAYQQLLESAAASVAALPYDEPAARPRSFRPWRWGWRLPRRDAQLLLPSARRWRW